MKLQPVSDYIIIEPQKQEVKTKSGIVLPDTVEKEKSERGRVIAVGQGRMTDQAKIIPLSVKKGQIVLFSKYGPDEIKVGGKEYYIIKEDNILAVID